MSDKAYYDVMFLNVNKQHIFEDVAGAEATGLKTAFVIPLYNRGLTRLVLGKLPGRVGNGVRQHADPRLAGTDIYNNLFWSLSRLYVNYAWRSGESRFFKAFDHWCASRIRSGRFRAKVYYVFQDYMSETCAAAKERGALLVAEQILNNSLAAQARIIESTRRVSFPVVCREYPLDQSVNERVLGIADRIVVPSGYVRGDLKVSTDKIWHVPYGAHPAAWRRSWTSSALSGPGPVVVAVWASSVRKGGHLLLEALLTRSGEELFPGYSGEVEFLLLGNLDPQFLPAVDKIHASSPRIKIRHGHMQHSELVRRLSQSDFFLCPSLSEGMSLAMLEAAAAGLPLVITPFCGLDAFVDGVHGVMIGDPSPAGIAKAIREIFLRRNQWPDLGQNAKGIVDGHSWTDFGRQIAAHIRGLLP